MIIANPAHREYIEENLAWDAVEHLGINHCGTCAVSGVLTIIDHKAPKLQMHQYAMNTVCREVRVCRVCIQEGALAPNPCEYESEEEHGHHSSCVRYCKDPGCIAMLSNRRVARFQRSIMLEQQQLRPDLWEGRYTTDPSVLERWRDQLDIETEEWRLADNGDAASIIRIRTRTGLPTNQELPTEMDEYLDLARQVLDLKDSQRDDPRAVSDALEERWGIGTPDWRDLVDTLLDWTKPLEDPRSGEEVHAFGKADPETADDWAPVIAYPTRPERRGP